MYIKLDEDGDAVDFCTRAPMKNKRKPMNSYRCCAACDVDHRMYILYHKKLIRFFENNLGKNINDVYSEFCRMARKETPINREWLLYRWSLRVHLHAEVNEGTVTTPRGLWGYTTLKEGDYFVRAGGCVLEKVVAEEVNGHRVYKRLESINETTSFRLEPIKYRRRISCGVFEDVVEYCWFKIVSTRAEVKREHLYPSKNENGRKICEWSTWWYFQDDVRKTTASKSEILKYKLNEGISYNGCIL